MQNALTPSTRDQIPHESDQKAPDSAQKFVNSDQQPPENAPEVAETKESVAEEQAPVEKPLTDEAKDDKIVPRWEEADFINSQAVQRHEKHLSEYGVTWPEYVQGARDLLNHSITNEIDGFTNDSGGIYRYDIEHNDFVIGAVIDGKDVIITRFKPRDGLNYWKGVKESEHADT